MLPTTVGRRLLFLGMVVVLFGASQAGTVLADLHPSPSSRSDAVTWHRPDNSSDTSGSGVEAGPPTQDIPAAYLEVVGQFDNLDYAPDLESGYALQETILVPVDGSSVVSTTTLRADVFYEIRVSGTFFVGGLGDMQGDAEYANFSNPPSSLQNHCAGDPNDVDLGIGINDNVIDNEKVPFWGDFEPGHVYAVTLAGLGAPIALNYHDCAYNDNSGDLTVEVWRPAAITWHVADVGSDLTGDGSVARPFATIQHGIDVASDGDTVLAHPGTYTENIDFRGKEITVGSLYITTGDADYILETVIDGNRNDHVVTFASGEAATATLSGLTITNGFAHGASAPGTEGGGIFCLNNSSPTLTHLRVTFNEAVGEGGGMYFAHCVPTIRDVAITHNLAGTGGGGIRYSYGSVNLENVVVVHNSAGSGGAGIQFYHAEGTVKNALIADNFGGGKGGALGFDGSSPTFTNVTIVGNRTTGHGGGLNVSYMSQPMLVNSIVWGNSPEQIYFDTDWPGEAVTIEYSDIQGGEAGIVTNGQGPVNWGDGNVDTSPRFVRPSLGNYRLANSSSCIGAGKVAGAPSTDIEGNPRPNPAGSNPDMGAYENRLGSPRPSTFQINLPLVSKAASSEPPVDVTPGIALRFPRMSHTATRLPDGKILVVGGSSANGQFPAEVELFDPATGQTSLVAPLHTARHDHTATLLQDGRVLVVGGYTLPTQWLADAEVYDPVAGTWTVVPPSYSHGTIHTATLMKDGRVLVVGGCIGGGLCTERVEIFDPQNNAWSEAQPLAADRAGQTAQLLEDGRVLVAGGWGSGEGPVGGDALLYDPQANTWTATGPMIKPRFLAQSVRLQDGRVLIAGGMTLEDKPASKISASAEIYDPAANAWTATADLAEARYYHGLVALADGKVLAIGGARNYEDRWTENSFVREIERYDPATAQWRVVGELPQPRAEATAALLPDGRVWLAGGWIGTTYFSDSWLIGK